MAELILKIMRPVARALGFVHEIRSGKWHLYGYSFQEVPNWYERLGHNFLYNDIALLQLLFAATPEPAQFLEEFIHTYAQDGQLKLYF